MKKNTWLVVLAGGSGTRFWPRSRASRPKQLLDIAGDESLLCTTLKRFSGQISEEQLIIVTTQSLLKATKEALPNFRGHFMVEPGARNTAPCLAMTMAWLRNRDPDAVAIVVPADHWIVDREGFLETMDTAVNYASEHEKLVTIGIAPTRPETGYGYIRSGKAVSDDGLVLEVDRFVEKPNKDVAETMVQDPVYLWNAGMFIWSTKTFFTELEKVNPQLVKDFEPYQAALAKGEDGEKGLSETYATTEIVSIDYALMEGSKAVVVLPGSFDWNDLGSFLSLYDLLPEAEGGVARAKRVMAIDSTLNLVEAPDKVVALLGVTNMMIVDTGDVLLVAAKERSQEVKKFVERIRAEGDKDRLL